MLKSHLSTVKPLWNSHFHFFKTSNVFPALPVLFPAVITRGNFILQIKLMPTLAYPAGNPCRVAEYKGMIRHIFGHYRPCPDKGVSAYGVSAYDRCISADGCAFFDQGCLEFVFSGNMTSGVDDIGEDHGRTATEMS